MVKCMRSIKERLNLWEGKKKGKKVNLIFFFIIFLWVFGRKVQVKQWITILPLWGKFYKSIYVTVIQIFSILEESLHYICHQVSYFISCKSPQTVDFFHVHYSRVKNRLRRMDGWMDVPVKSWINTLLIYVWII